MSLKALPSPKASVYQSELRAPRPGQSGWTPPSIGPRGCLAPEWPPRCLTGTEVWDSSAWEGVLHTPLPHTAQRGPRGARKEQKLNQPLPTPRSPACSWLTGQLAQRVRWRPRISPGLCCSPLTRPR